MSTEIVHGLVLIHRCLLCGQEKENAVVPDLFRDFTPGTSLWNWRAHGVYYEEAPSYVYDDPKYDQWHACSDGRRGRLALIGERRGAQYELNYEKGTTIRMTRPDPT